MRKTHLTSAVAGVVALSLAGIAIANPVGDTNLDATTTVKSKKAGTKKKPRGNGVTVTVAGSTKSGAGQPSTSTAIKVDFPRGWRYNGKLWPKKQRCNAELANTQQSNSVCPKKSIVGSGDSQALAFNGFIVQNLKVTAHVLSDGNLGFFIQGSQPVAVAEMLPSKVSKGGDLNVTIPANVQEPLPNAPTGITLLKTGIAGKTTIKKTFKVKRGGKTKKIKRRVRLNLLETTACKNKVWKIKVTNVYRDGQLTDPTPVACRK